MADGGEPAWMKLVGLFPPNRAARAAYQNTVGGQLFGTDPFASVWLPVLVLLAWILVPVTVGYLRLRDAQIG
jgi:ABC-2 type transport system permease protein